MEYTLDAFTKLLAGGKCVQEHDSYCIDRENQSLISGTIWRTFTSAEFEAVFIQEYNYNEFIEEDIKLTESESHIPLTYDDVDVYDDNRLLDDEEVEELIMTTTSISNFDMSNFTYSIFDDDSYKIVYKYERKTKFGDDTLYLFINSDNNSVLYHEFYHSIRGTRIDMCSNDEIVEHLGWYFKADHEIFNEIKEVMSNGNVKK